MKMIDGLPPPPLLPSSPLPAVLLTIPELTYRGQQHEFVRDPASHHARIAGDRNEILHAYAAENAVVCLLGRQSLKS